MASNGSGHACVRGYRGMANSDAMLDAFKDDGNANCYFEINELVVDNSD
jgi:hypothetical protein